MKIWNVGNKTYSGTGTAIQDHLAAIQYSRTGDLEIVPLSSSQPDFSEKDKTAIEEIGRLCQDGMGLDEFCEMLYLAGYRKRADISEDMLDEQIGE